MTPNQYRCETCKHNVPAVRREGFRKCDLSNYLLDGISDIILMTGIVGCASHSDFNPQAERDCPVCGGKLMCHRWCIDRDCGWDSTKQSKQDKEDWIRKKFFEWISTKIQSPSIYACGQKWEELREGKGGE